MEPETKQSLKILLAALLLIAATCDPKVKFERPQPNGKKDLETIPARFRGKYQDLSDSTTLTIDARSIVKEDLKIARLTKQQLWAEIDTVFERDTTVHVVDNMTVDFKFYGDSVQLTTYDADTLFSLFKNHVIRKFRGYHFLNTPLEDNLWKVQIMKASGDSLTLEDLVSQSEADSLSMLVNMTIIRDTIEDKIEEYRLNPTKPELKLILAKKEKKYGYVKE
ncbi:MAG: hypothetical protein PVF73_02100 [Bacteroidales bacterium]|jgi:hypothetical protein